MNNAISAIQAKATRTSHIKFGNIIHSTFRIYNRLDCLLYFIFTIVMYSL